MLGQRRAPFPQRLASRLSTCVGQLDADGTAVGMDEINDFLQWFDLAVLPKAQIRRSDATPWIDRCTLGEDQSGTAESELPKVDHVPRRRTSGIGRMLAHRRDDDPIVQNEFAKLKWLEKKWVTGGHTKPVS
jgi:hypothetical protein